MCIHHSFIHPHTLYLHTYSYTLYTHYTYVRWCNFRRFYQQPVRCEPQGMTYGVYILDIVHMYYII